MKAALLWLVMVAAAPAQCPPGASSCPPPPSPAPAATYRFRAEGGHPAPWATAVRISWHQQNNLISVGSGTIIESNPDGLCLVMTAAHVVAGSPRDGLTVEIFGPLLNPLDSSVGKRKGSFRGNRLDHDDATDVGLVVFRADRELPAAPIVEEGWSPPAALILCSLGCSNGSDPTARTEVATGARAFDSGWKGTECRRRPEPGRSGGGLYTDFGRLAGVCDFADTGSKTGLYASAESMRAILRKNGLAELADGRPRRAGPLAPDTPIASAPRTPPPDLSLQPGGIPGPTPAAPNPPASAIPSLAAPLAALAGTLGGTGVMGLIWAAFARLKGRSGIPIAPADPPPDPLPTPAQLVELLEASIAAEAEAARARTESEAKARARDELLARVRALIREPAAHRPN